MTLHLVQFIILKLFEAKAEKSGRRGNKSFSAARNVCYIIATIKLFVIISALKS